ncbi:MAG: hypothetical protein ACRDMZ_22320, partial [Solirubrobacteraceae bacterium]
MLSARDLDDGSLLRAATVLGCYAHAYVRSEPEPATLPPSIERPWEEVAARLGRPYAHLTYVDLIVHNWRRVDPGGPCAVPNLRLLAPTVDNQEERVFHLTQVEILARSAPIVRAVLDAQDAVAANDVETLISAFGIVSDTLRSMAAGTFMQIDPNPRSATHVDPVVWAKTVAPLAVPLREGLPGPSGTSSPIFHLLDAWIGRASYESVLGKETVAIRNAHPLAWQELFSAVAEVSTDAYVSAAGRKDLREAWADVRDAYAGSGGWLERHRLKVYGYLELAFKLGRSVTIGGFEGLFDDRTWERVDHELDRVRLERARTAPPVHARLASIEPEGVNPLGPTALTLDLGESSLQLRPGDRCAVLPESSSDLVDRTLRSMNATGSERVKLSASWRAALLDRTGVSAAELTLRELLRWGTLRPVERDVAKIIARVSRSRRVEDVIEARDERSWELWELLNAAAESGWSPSRPWRAQAG